MDDFCQKGPTPPSELWPRPHLIYMNVQNNTINTPHSLYSSWTRWAPPRLAPDSLRVLAGLEPPNPSSFSKSVGAAVWSMIPLIITAMLSPHLSSSQLAQPGAALCRLPLRIRTPLEKLFTHLSSPQAPLHFVCPLKDPIEDKITFFFFSKVRNNCFMNIGPKASDKSGVQSSCPACYYREHLREVSTLRLVVRNCFSFPERHSSFRQHTPPWHHPRSQSKVSLAHSHSSPLYSAFRLQKHTWLCRNEKAHYVWTYLSRVIILLIVLQKRGWNLWLAPPRCLSGTASCKSLALASQPITAVT